MIKENFMNFKNKYSEIIIVILLATVIILCYRLWTKNPSYYDCLKLGSDMARVACLKIYHGAK